MSEGIEVVKFKLEFEQEFGPKYVFLKALFTMKHFLLLGEKWEELNVGAEIWS